MIDIKFPIGLLLMTIGGLLLLYGIMTISDVTVYVKSLNININIWMGIGLLLFGSVMFFLSIKQMMHKKRL
jgi:hypothetical protein